MTQLTIFQTGSPINKEKLTGQNKLLFEMLERRSRTMFNVPGIGYLNSRISDLRNKSGVIIYDRFITVNGTLCKEYSLQPFKLFEEINK